MAYLLLQVLWPPEAGKIDTALAIETDTFPFQRASLMYGFRSPRSLAQCPARIDHAMPGDVGLIRQGSQGETDMARCAAFGDTGDAAIGADAPLWYLRDDRMDTRIERELMIDSDFRFLCRHQHAEHFIILHRQHHR